MISAEWSYAFRRCLKGKAILWKRQSAASLEFGATFLWASHRVMVQVVADVEFVPFREKRLPLCVRTIVFHPVRKKMVKRKCKQLTSTTKPGATPEKKKNMCFFPRHGIVFGCDLDFFSFQARFSIVLLLLFSFKQNDCFRELGIII